MSAAKRKNLTVEKSKEHDNSESESESDDNSESNKGAYTGKEEIQVDFEGRNPVDTDFDGIRQLLQQLFLKAHINLSQIAEQIIGMPTLYYKIWFHTLRISLTEQNFIGSVVTQSELDDEDDNNDDEELYDSNMIFGITTVLNITKKKDLECFQQLKNYIIEKAEKHAENTVAAQFRNFLSNNDRSIGFLINERFINIPSKISVPLLENLYKEIKRAHEKKMDYNFSYYVMIIKFYRETNKKSKCAEDIYSNPEEEIVCKEAITSFEYSVESDADAGTIDWVDGENNLTPFRKVILFEATKLPHIILSIKEFTSE